MAVSAAFSSQLGARVNEDLGSEGPMERVRQPVLTREPDARHRPLADVPSIQDREFGSMARLVVPAHKRLGGLG
jgi:hypothetical protein